MQKSDTIFWGIVAVAALFLIGDFSFGSKVNAQQTQPALAQQVANQAAPVKGMGCMAKGGGCGCGMMGRK